jgi:hypothetical protein
MVVVLEAFSPSSLLCLVRVRRSAWWLCWRRPPLLLTLLGAGEEECMVVVLEASFTSSSLCLVRVRRRAWWLCWRRPLPPPPHSAWCE